MTTIFVSGALANKCLNGGEAWVRLSWIEGFRQLGFDIHFVEQIGRDGCLDASGHVTDFDSSLNLSFFKQVTEDFGISHSSSLIYENGEQVYGLSYRELLALAEDAALLVNISGHLSHEPLMKRLRVKAYIDIDPGFTQFWHADPKTAFCLNGHDFYFTIGENIGTSACSIPTSEILWRAIRQPVVLKEWPLTETNGACERFTTIANWRGPFGVVQFGDRSFGLKVHEFRKFIELPRHSSQKFEIALNIHPADERDLQLLIEHGWLIVDPLEVASDPRAFRRYTQTSGAEFSVAQGIYVDTNSGWFSDRTIRYLASGKPALVQETGFSRNLPTGEGLVPFRTLDEAIGGAERIARRYESHSRAARALAEEYFESSHVLGRFLDEVGVTP